MHPRAFLNAMAAVVAACLILMPVSGATAAGMMKLGVVDFTRVLKESAAGKSALAEVKTEGEKYRDDLKSLQDGIETDKERLVKEGMLMDEIERSELERDLRIRVNDLRAKQKEAMQTVQAFRNSILLFIQDDIIDLGKEIGEKQGYTLILGKKGVMYCPDRIDITDEMIQLYNAKFVMQAGKWSEMHKQQLEKAKEK